MSLPIGYKANRNKLNVALNAHQGDRKKVLTVCSAGLLRSPTLAYVLQREFGYNTRSVGSTHTFALIPISEALIAWADEIVFVDFDAYDILDAEIIEDIKDYAPVIKILDVPDDYNYGTEELENILLELYLKS